MHFIRIKWPFPLRVGTEEESRVAMEEDWEGEANMRGDVWNSTKPLEPQNLLLYESVVFGILEERHLCMVGREGRIFRGGTSLFHPFVL